MIDLLLFADRDEVTGQAEHAGIAGVVVDLERRGKHRRQVGWDTQVTTHDLGVLAATRQRTNLPIICRINSVGERTREEVVAAIKAGADEILVPMVRTKDEVVRVLDVVDGCAAVGAMVETAAAVDVAGVIGALPIARVYVGLNDLAIDRGSRTIFDALADGTVDHVRRAIPPDVPFGVAGLTLPELGDPLPCRHLLRELARLGASFTFLRRSFLRDLGRLPLDEAIRRIQDAWAQDGARSAADVQDDHWAAAAAIDALPTPGPPAAATAGPTARG